MISLRLGAKTTRHRFLRNGDDAIGNGCRVALSSVWVKERLAFFAGRTRNDKKARPRSIPDQLKLGAEAFWNILWRHVLEV